MSTTSGVTALRRRLVMNGIPMRVVNDPESYKTAGLSLEDVKALEALYQEGMRMSSIQVKPLRGGTGEAANTAVGTLAKVLATVREETYMVTLPRYSYALQRYENGEWDARESEGGKYRRMRDGGVLAIPDLCWSSLLLLGGANAQRVIDAIVNASLSGITIVHGRELELPSKTNSAEQDLLAPDFAAMISELNLHKRTITYAVKQRGSDQ